MSPEAVFSINNGFLLLICGLFSFFVPFGSAQQRGSKSEEFRCPEDFGYYPHPSDCSQYFVCVFGDPLLESCTGGLMYSHDLRTCDWPRNVGCGVTAAASSKNENIGISSASVHSGRQHTTASWRQEIPEPQNDEIPDKNLYEEEDLGPVEEVESDRQQRVYRGQPPTLGQVARDRDGIIRHANALQTSSGIEKVKPIAVVSFGSHHQSLSKGNSTNSLRFEPYTEDLVDLTKLETNRIKRDLTSRGKNNEIQTLDETTRGTGGYALRYRPLPSDETDSTDKNHNLIVGNESANKVNTSYESHLTPTATSIQPLHSLPNKNSNRYTPTLIKLSPNGLRPIHHIVSKHRILTTTTPRSTVHTNPAPASSSLFSHYSDPSYSFSNPGHRYAYPLDDSPVATDFTIVSVAPKSQPAGISPMRPTMIPPLQHHYQPQPSMLHHYAELNPFPHMPKPPPPVYPVRNLGHYPQPYYYNPINHYAGPLATNQFYPTPNNRFVHYNTETEPSIVTLSYPPEQNPLEQMLTTAATTEATTTTETTTTTVDNSTNRTDEKPSNTSETKRHETKKPRPEDSSEIDDDPDPDFNSNDEAGDEVEDHEDEEFEKIYFEDDDDDDNTNHSIPEIKFSAKKQTTTEKPKDEDELDGGYSFTDKEVTVSNKSEEDSPADDQVEYEEVQEEEDEDKGTEEEEKDSSTEVSQDETADDADTDEESLKKGEDHLIKPAISYYNRYLTDHEENPFTNPDFDFKAYLSELTKPQKSQKKRMERLQKKAEEIANRMSKMDHVDLPSADLPSNHEIEKRSVDTFDLTEASPLIKQRGYIDEVPASANHTKYNKTSQSNTLASSIPAEYLVEVPEIGASHRDDSTLSKIQINVNINYQNESKKDIQDLSNPDSEATSKQIKKYRGNSTNFESSSHEKQNTEDDKSVIPISTTPIYPNSTERLLKTRQKQDFKNRRRRQPPNRKQSIMLVESTTDQEVGASSPREESFQDTRPTEITQEGNHNGGIKTNKKISNLEVVPQRTYTVEKGNEEPSKNKNLSNSALLSDKYATNSSSNHHYGIYLVELPEYFKYLPLEAQESTFKIDHSSGIDLENRVNQSTNTEPKIVHHLISEDPVKHLGAVNKSLVGTTRDMLNSFKKQNTSDKLILLQVEYTKPNENGKGSQNNDPSFLLPATINEAFKEVNINEDMMNKAQDHLIAPVMSQYNQYLTDHRENSFTNPNFDYRSHPVYPKFKRLRPVVRLRTTPKPVHQQVKNSYKTNTTNAEQVIYASQKEDRIVNIRAGNNTSNSSNGSPSAKMQKSSARLVPLALLHTYKPANHSYLHKQLRMPTTKNFYELPVDFGNSYFDPDKFHSFSKSSEYEPFQPPSSLSPPSENDSEDGEEENEEDAPSENNKDNGNENADEYYDDYAEEYTDDNPLERPLSKPNVPSIPSRIKNIDKEVFGEKEHHREEHTEDEESPQTEEDESPQQDEEESPQQDREESPQQEEDEEEPEDKGNEEVTDEEQEDGTEEEDSRQKQEEDEEYEEDDGRNQEENSEDEEEPQNNHNNNAETVSSSRKVKQPQYLSKGHHIDQIMTPHHRKNKYLQNPLPSLSTYLEPPKQFTPPAKSGTLHFRPAHSPQPNLTPAFTTTPTPRFQRKPMTENDKKFRPTTMGTLKLPSRPLKSNEDKKYSPANSNPSYVLSSNNLPNSVSNPQSQNSLIYNILSHNPPYRIDQRNKTASTVSKGKSINEDLNKNYAYYNVPNVNGISVQTASKSKRPLSSVPSYIVEDTRSSVPTTSKSIYNVTKIDPFYSVYDENQEIYRNSEIDQFHKQRKPADFHLIQDSHRLQPHTSQSLNNPTIYTNQDYRQQSEIDGDSHQSDKLITSKLFVDSYPGASARPPAKYPLPHLTPPVVELQPPYADQPTTESVRGRAADAHLGETSFAPKTALRPTTAKPARGISFPKGSFVLSTEPRDHFRIIVEPVEGATSTPELKLTTKPGSKPDRVQLDKLQLDKLQLGEKFSSVRTTTVTERSTTVATSTAKNDDSKSTNRRFYIPKTNPVERKLHFYETTPRPDPPSTRQVGSSTQQLYDDELEDDYEEVETSQEDANYIDNKIVDYSSSKQPASQTPAGFTSKAPSTPYELKSRPKEASTRRPDKEVTTADRCPQCNEKPFVRGRNRGSVTYSPGGNDFVEGVTATAGRSRPTLKPSTSIVTKNSEGVDIYKYAPKRPDNVFPTPQPDKVAAKCRKDICLLPDCSCGGKDIPGDLSPEETPQMVLLTFDDSVNELNRGLYVDLFEKGRVNPNGCPISATFYVSHEWTDYSMVQNLYAAGHEIASHSVSHSFGEQFSQRKWTKEIVGQREILSAYGGVRQEDIRGMRAPFLAVGGNKMFKMLYDANFTYDSSMPIYENRPPSWPYTMDYKLFHDCMIPPCPTRSYPGVWEVPMVMWQDLNGGRCSMGDACSNPPTADGVYKMLIKNFERHFSTNRSPFGLFYHSSWFTQPHHKEGFLAFLDTIVNMPEVWLVTNWQVIQWVRDPTPISRLNKFSPFNCDYPERPRRCNNAKVCNLWHKSGVRYLKTCQACPDVYPWTGKTGVRNSRIDIEEPPSTD